MAQGQPTPNQTEENASFILTNNRRNTISGANRERNSSANSYTSTGNGTLNRNATRNLEAMEWYRNYNISKVINGNTISATFRFGIG